MDLLTCSMLFQSRWSQDARVRNTIPMYIAEIVKKINKKKGMLSNNAISLTVSATATHFRISFLTHYLLRLTKVDTPFYTPFFL